MYTSGRTVKSKTRKPTTIASATADVRKLVRKHLPDAQGITVDSTMTADPQTLASQVRTVISYAPEVDASDVAIAVQSLHGYVTSTWTSYAITIIRAV